MEFAEIGRRLNVEHILEGSVRKAGNHSRHRAAHQGVGWLSSLVGALECTEKAHSRAPSNVIVIAMLAGLLVRTGDPGRSEQLLRKLGDGQAFGAPLAFVFFHSLCSEVDKAADWAKKAIGQRDPRIVGSLFALGGALPSSAHWPELAKMMNLA